MDAFVSSENYHDFVAFCGIIMVENEYNFRFFFEELCVADGRVGMRCASVPSGLREELWPSGLRIRLKGLELESTYRPSVLR